MCQCLQKLFQCSTQSHLTGRDHHLSKWQNAQSIILLNDTFPKKMLHLNNYTSIQMRQRNTCRRHIGQSMGPSHCRDCQYATMQLPVINRITDTVHLYPKMLTRTKPSRPRNKTSRPWPRPRTWPSRPRPRQGLFAAT